MFITHHDLAEYHAMLRCFSTAPLYITDSEPSNKQIWKRLGGLDPQGNYRIVKATTNSSVRLPSTAFTDVTGQGNGPALKVALAVPSANGAVVGLWNCRGQGGIAVDALTHEELAEALKLDKHDRMLRERYVVMYDGNTAQVQDYEVSESSRFVLPINLATGKSVAVTVSQIQSFTSFDLAVLGLADKFVGLCSVLNVEEVKARPTQALPTEEDREESAPAQDKASEDNGQAGQKQAEDTDAIETTPLLPHPRARSPSLRSGSRLLALLLFYRRDLSAARSSLLRDFFRAPFKTLFNEIRAIFSGPSILPEGTNEDVQDVTSAQQETQEPLQATSQSYGTLINSPDTAVQHEGDVSVASDSSNATAVDKDEPSVNQIVVTLSVAGQLVLWLPGFSHEAFSITLQGNGVADKLISVSGDCVIVDMEQAAQEIGFKGTSDEAWKVGIMKR